MMKTNHLWWPAFPGSLILRAQADVLATSIYAYELDDERTSVKLTIEGDDTVLFEKDFEPSSGTVV